MMTLLTYPYERLNYDPFHNEVVFANDQTAPLQGQIIIHNTISIVRGYILINLLPHEYIPFIIRDECF